MKKIIWVVLFIVLLEGCSKEKSEVDYSTIEFDGAKPFSIVVDTTIKKGNGFVLQTDLQYLSKWGDTLNVSVLEYKGDVYALDYYMNSGRFLGTQSILRGKFLEQSFRSDSRIFIFKHDRYRHYERRTLEAFVRSIPGTRMGFPQEFLSLPFEHRESKKTSVQTKNFLGVRSYFPVLEQSYSDDYSNWNVARSWESIDETLFKKWVVQLKKQKPKRIEIEDDVYYFSVGEGTHGMTKLLSGGRVVVVWGYLDWPDLKKHFDRASDRIFEARF